MAANHRLRANCEGKRGKILNGKFQKT
jgi:hypothetical protein